MKKLIFTLIGILGFAGIAFGLPYFQSTQTLIPFQNNAYDVGTSTAVYRNLYVTQICLSADCKTAWPTGGSGSGTISTSTTPTIGHLPYWTSISQLGSVATTTVGAGTGISLSAGVGFLVGGSNLTITNSAPDQTVAFTGGTNVTIGGTYPNFTITDNSQVAGSYLTSSALTPYFLLSDWFSTTTQKTISSLPALSITKSQVSDLGTLFTQAIASTTFQDRTDWTTHDSYPSGCSAGQYVSTIGDTLTCGTPTNTTYTATYPISLTGSAFGLSGMATGTIANGTGITVTAGQSVIGSGLTITNSSPDQTVVLSNGTGISTSGTYPNFTITNTLPQTFTYPFPSNATSTPLTFTGLFTITNASSTKFTIDELYDSNGSQGGSGEVLSSTVTGTDWIAAGGTGTVTNIATTWPIIGGPITTTGTLTFGGLSTSTALTTGRLAMVSGVNTFADVATTTLTATAPLSLDQPVVKVGGSNSVLSCATATGSVAGCLSSANWTTFNGKADTSSAMTGTFDGIDFTGGALGANSLWYGGAGAEPSELAIGAGGTVLTVVNGSPAWFATSSFPLLGDVTGTLGVTVVGNDSHDHTATTISGLGVADFTSANISQWTNDSAFTRFPFTVNTGYNSTSTVIGFNGLFSTASSTFSSNLYLPTITSALTLTGADGLIAEYTGTTCTNQFVRSLSALGAATCATVGTGDVSGLDISDDTNLAGTWPIILTGDALTFGGLSTSTAAVTGNIPYFSGVNTFANVATTTLTATAPLSLNNPVAKVGGSNSILTCATATGAIPGCISAANWNTFNNKIGTSSTPTLGNLAYWGGSATVPALATVATSSVTCSGGTTCSNLIALGSSPTISSFAYPFPSAATSTPLTFTGLFTVTNASTTLGSFSYASSTLGYFGTLSIGTSGRLYIPANTNPTITATGDIGINTTTASSSIRYYNGTAEMALYPTIQKTFTIASTTLWNLTATTTIPLGFADRSETWTRIICSTDKGTAGIQFGNYTASSTYQVLSSTKNNAVQTNTFSLYQDRYVSIGTLASSPNYISCSITIRPDAD